TITGNPNPPGFPANVDTSQPQWDPNNPRWLPVFPQDPALAPRPIPTAPPFGDYPLARYDRGNTGRVPALPRPPLQSSWGGLSQAAQVFVSPLAVSGPNVVSSSQDGQIYSFNRDSGTQRWRFNLATTASLAPAAQDNLLYIPYTGNKMVVLQDAGDRANVISTVDLPGAASTSPTFLNDVIFLGTGDGGATDLVAMRRENLADRRVFNEPTSRLLQPAIGQETIYVPANRLWALDTNLWRGTELLWTQPDLNNLTAPPVYITPGVIRNSELYAADQSGNIYALDANTGARIWIHPFGTPATMLAVNDNYLFAAGGGIIRAISRLSGQAVWSQQTGGQLTGGPWVTADRVMVATQGGTIFVYDALTGTVVDSSTVLPGPINVAPAVSQEWIFVPTSNTIFGYRGQP
ncbi:MAG: PQQ-binding-like beta-propeller repeat protein, partial [Caldilineaceae bacterium]|nr:PQQ-binding-like beta-propeller repeat protein [Caldilineaceae bacterium]